MHTGSKDTDAQYNDINTAVLGPINQRVTLRAVYKKLQALKEQALLQREANEELGQQKKKEE